MKMMQCALWGAGLLAASFMGAAMAGRTNDHGQGHHHRQEPKALLKAERAAMQSLAEMKGVWRGKATVTMRGGRKHSFTQTERVGPFLNGSVLVMEGRGYASDGSANFNALGVISYQPRSQHYFMHSYARGRAGNFRLKPTDDGFSWSIKAGPMSMDYTATINNGTWHEVGVRNLPNGKSVKFFEMTLHRVGDTDWPAAGAVPAKADADN